MPDAPKAAAKITVPLIGEALIALESTAKEFGLSKTDTVNRAIQAYAFFMTLQRTGGEIYVRQTPDGGLHRFFLHPDDA